MAFDDEMRARVRAHRRDRGERFVTVEVPEALEDAVRDSAEAKVAVIDCLTLWLTNLLLAGQSDAEIEARVERLAREADELIFATMGVLVRLRPGPLDLVA